MRAARKSAKPRKARSARSVEATPQERLAIILKHYEEHANTARSNPLVARRTPPEALKACMLLLERLFTDAIRAGDGIQAIYLMLYGALGDISDQLEPLFDAARQAAKEARP